jgi:hypothetical protein
LFAGGGNAGTLPLRDLNLTRLGYNLFRDKHLFRDGWLLVSGWLFSQTTWYKKRRPRHFADDIAQLMEPTLVLT